MILIPEQLNIINIKPSIKVTNEVVNCVCDNKLCNEKFEYLEGYSNAIFEIESFDSFYNYYYAHTDNLLQFQK